MKIMFGYNENDAPEVLLHGRAVQVLQSRTITRDEAAEIQAYMDRVIASESVGQYFLSEANWNQWVVNLFGATIIEEDPPSTADAPPADAIF